MKLDLSEKNLKEWSYVAWRADLAPDDFSTTQDDRGQVALRSRTSRDRISAVFSMLRGIIGQNIRAEIEFGHHLLFVPVLIGTGAVIWFSFSSEPAGVAILVLLAAALSWSFLMRRAGYHAGLVCRALVLVAFGMVVAMSESQRNATIILDSPVTCRIEGIVLSREIDHAGHWRYQVQLTSTAQPALKRPPRRVSLLARSRHAPIEIGQPIAGKVRMSPPSGPALPGLNDFAFAAYFDGIGAVGFFYGPPRKPERMGEATISPDWRAWLKGAIERQRGEIGFRIRTVLPGDTGAFATAIVTDERRAISPETTEALRLAGLAHIIAISGLNMALAAGIFFVGLRSLLSLSIGLAHSRAIKKIAAFGALLAVSAYFMVSGFAVSAERAYIMMVIMLGAVFLDVNALSLRNVALSALVIIILDPSSVMGPSFQMSFSATAALVAGYGTIQAMRGDDHTENILVLPKYLDVLVKFATGIFLTSLIGGLSTAIYSVEHFHRIAAYGLPANLAAMPIISFVVMPAALVAMLLMPFGLERLPLLVMGEGLDLVIAIARWTSSIGGDVVLGRMPGWFMPVMSAGFLVLVLLKTALRLAGIPVLAGGLLVLAIVGGPVKPDLVVSEDGRLVGMLSGDVISTNLGRPPGFIFQQWQRALKIVRHVPPEQTGTTVASRPLRWSMSAQERASAETVMRSTVSRLRDGRFICRGGAWCMARHHGGLLVGMIDDPAHVPLACNIADLVVTPHRWKKRRCANGHIIISRETLRQSGSLEVMIGRNDPAGKDVTFRTAINQQSRAWTRHRFYDWRTNAYTTPSPWP